MILFYYLFPPANPIHSITPFRRGLINSDSPPRNYLPGLWRNCHSVHLNTLRTLHKSRRNRGLASIPRWFLVRKTLTYQFLSFLLFVPCIPSKGSFKERAGLYIVTSAAFLFTGQYEDTLKSGTDVSVTLSFLDRVSASPLPIAQQLSVIAIRQRSLPCWQPGIEPGTD